MTAPINTIKLALTNNLSITMRRPELELQDGMITLRKGGIEVNLFRDFIKQGLSVAGIKLSLANNPIISSAIVGYWVPNKETYLAMGHFLQKGCPNSFKELVNKLRSLRKDNNGVFWIPKIDKEN